MPTLATLAKSGTEDGHQTALFAWANMACRFGFVAAYDNLCYTERGYAKERYSRYEGVKPLELLYAVPNGGKRDKITAAKLKATGVKAGVPDIALDYPTDMYCGLRIELKRPASSGKAQGVVTTEQRVWLDRLAKNGYAAVVCVGWEQAARTIFEYLSK